MLAASVLPAAFALYLAANSAYRDHYALLFGWIFLIDAALLAIAIARRYEVLHAFGAVTTVLALVIWISTAYLPGAVFPVIGFVALFIVFYLAAPAIAARFGEPFEGPGEHAVLASPLLLAAFPLLVMREPRAESPAVLFPALFALVLLIVWRSFAEATGRLYFIAAFFALATEAAWSSRYLTPATLSPALVTYAAFALLYLGVPQIARRRGDAPPTGGRTGHRAPTRADAPELFRRRPRGRGRTVGTRAAARDPECGAIHRERECGRCPRSHSSAA